MTSEADICRSCMMCCNGFLFRRVDVTAEEKDRLGDKPSFGEGPGGQLYMKLGCPHLDRDVGCSVYDTRPAQCAAFSCLLLQRVQEGELTASEGMVIVRDMHRLFSRLQNLCRSVLPDRKWPYLLVGRGRLNQLLARAEKDGAALSRFDRLQLDVQRDTIIVFMRLHFYPRFMSNAVSRSRPRAAKDPETS